MHWTPMEVLNLTIIDSNLFLYLFVLLFRFYELQHYSSKRLPVLTRMSQKNGPCFSFLFPCLLSQCHTESVTILTIWKYQPQTEWNIIKKILPITGFVSERQANRQTDKRVMFPFEDDVDDDDGVGDMITAVLMLCMQTYILRQD